MSGTPIQVLLVQNGASDSAPIARQLTTSSVAAFHVEEGELGEAAMLRLESNHVDVVLLHASPAEAIALLPRVREKAPSVPVVVLSEKEDESAAVEVVRAGAQDFLVRSRTDGPSLAHGLRYAIERKRAEEALQKSEAFYHSLVESLPQHIFRKDLLGRFTFCNRRLCRGMGRPLEDILGRTDSDFFPAELADKYRTDDLRVIETGTTFEAIEEFHKPDGGTLHVQVIKTPVYDAFGKLIGTQGIFWDITERVRNEQELRRACGELVEKESKIFKTMEMLKTSHEELIQAQLQLIQAEKLESVGRLAAGVAHEVKNPLAILLMGLTYLAEGEVRDPAADQEVMRAMREAIHRADIIVRGLVDFSANRRLDAENLDLNDMIRRALLLVKHELTGGHVNTVTELRPDLPLLMLDPTRIQQVFVNLFMNAVHAMPTGGTLTVRTYTRQLPETIRDDGSRRAERFRAGDTVVTAEVEDTGTGIPPEKLSKVFDPFFTTKAAGRGTGLGLTVVQKIVELHDGVISIANLQDAAGPAARTGIRITLTFKPIGSDNHEHTNEQPVVEAHSHR